MLQYDGLEATDENLQQFREDAASEGYATLAEVFKDLRQKMDYHKAEESRVRKFFDALSTQVIPEKLAEDGMQGIKLADGAGRIELRPNAYCSIKAGQGQALQNWLNENEFGDIIKETVNASTLKSFVKTQIENGELTPPESIVNYQPYVRATIVKG